jgi:hypothetical protein
MHYTTHTPVLCGLLVQLLHFTITAHIRAQACSDGICHVSCMLASLLTYAAAVVLQVSLKVAGAALCNWVMTAFYY